MTPKEKAKELVNKYKLFFVDLYLPEYIIKKGKLCALICVEEKLKENIILQEMGLNMPQLIARYIYLQKVKQEIETS